MTMLGFLRKVLGRTPEASPPDRARAADERQQLEQARAWERRGGPVDPGMSG